jgi:hypothetical protein
MPKLPAPCRCKQVAQDASVFSAARHPSFQASIQGNSPMNEILSTETTIQLNTVEQVTEQQVRELSAAEVMAVAGGPIIQNNNE